MSFGLQSWAVAVPNVLVLLAMKGSATSSNTRPTRQMAGSVQVLLATKENATNLVAEHAASVVVKAGGRPRSERLPSVVGQLSNRSQWKQTSAAMPPAQV